MSDTELLPCAHCGGEADFAETNKKHVVECQSCVLSTSVPTHSKETAALYWSKRAPITLDQAKQVLAEAGMVVVPAEPTEAMLLAAKKADCDHSDNEDWLFDEREYGDVTRQYKAMIAAQGECNEH